MFTYSVFSSKLEMNTGNCTLFELILLSFGLIICVKHISYLGNHIHDLSLINSTLFRELMEYISSANKNIFQKDGQSISIKGNYRPTFPQ